MNDQDFVRKLRWTAPVLVAAAIVLQLLAFWPGIMVWDAIRQYGQALSGRYDDWHPPAMSWLWRQLGIFGPGPAPMLVLQTLLYWSGLGLLAAAALRHGRTALAVVIAAIALMPIPLVLVGTILKDSLMAGALLLAAGVIAIRRPGDRLLEIAAAALLVFAATLRFNAVPACLPLAMLLIPDPYRRTRKHQAMAALGITLALFAAMPIANRLLRAEKSGVALSLVIYDLGGITRFSGTDAFPPIAVADPIGTNTACYTPVDWDVYAWWGPAPCPIQFAAVRDWFRDHRVSADLFWLQALLRHPLAYAEHRTVHYDHNLRFVVDETVLHSLSLQSDPNRWGYSVGPSALRDAFAGAAAASLWTPLGWPICWLAVAFATLLLTPRADRSLARPLAWSALLYGLTYLPLSVATEVRYHFWTGTAAALAAAMAVDAMRRDGFPPPRRWLPATAPLIAVTAIGIAARLL